MAAFAANDGRTTRLIQLYAQLPADLKELGPQLGDVTPAGARAALEALRATRR